MNVFEIYIKSSRSIDELASLFISIIQVGISQKRVGINRGGEYYYFESFGLKFELLHNTGEVMVSERSSWPFYLLVYSEVENAGEQRLRQLTEWVAFLLSRNDAETRVDQLT